MANEPLGGPRPCCRLCGKKLRPLTHWHGFQQSDGTWTLEEACRQAGANPLTVTRVKWADELETHGPSGALLAGHRTGRKYVSSVRWATGHYGGYGDDLFCGPNCGYKWAVKHIRQWGLVPQVGGPPPAPADPGGAEEGLPELTGGLPSAGWF